MLAATMTRAATLASLSSLLALALLGCGAHGKTGIPEGSDKPWAQMDETERMEHMGAVVVPRMKAVFQGHDPQRFASFGCATCHGDSGSFEMPNPQLPELDAANLYKKHRKATPDMVKLMWKEVEPAMGEALALTYGFEGEISCHSCHVVIHEK